MDLSSLDVRYIVKELQELVGGRVEKVYSTEDRTDVLLQIYARTKRFLRIMPGALGLHSERPEYPSIAPQFAMALRKYLSGTRLLKVEQQGFDRIIIFTFGNTSGESTLVVELVPPGNVLLVRDGKIRTLAQHHAFKDRAVRGGVPYVPPPAAFIPEDERGIIDRISTSDRGIASTLAVVVGLGGVYAEEACARAGIDQERVDLQKEEVARVARAVQGMLDLPIAPHTDGKRAYPFKMARECASREGTFLEAIGDLLPPPAIERAEKAEKPKKERVKTMIVAQERRIIELEKEVETNQRIAERIYEEYLKVQEILATKGDRLPYGARKKEGMIEVDLDG